MGGRQPFMPNERERKGMGGGVRLGVLQVVEEEGVGSAMARRVAGDPGQ
jgi:hypothetical protein